MDQRHGVVMDKGPQQQRPARETRRSIRGTQLLWAQFRRCSLGGGTSAGLATWRRSGGESRREQQSSVPQTWSRARPRASVRSRDRKKWITPWGGGGVIPGLVAATRPLLQGGVWPVRRDRRPRVQRNTLRCSVFCGQSLASVPLHRIVDQARGVRQISRSRTL